MLESLHLLAYAKINLTLDVGGVRPDGYHEIRSVMQTISLADELTLTMASGGISLTCSRPELAERGNLAYRALELLQGRLPGGVHLHLIKRIPVAAGLGGGSSDAAAALRGASLLYDLQLPPEEMFRLAASLGSDVPFFLTGGTALAEGRGELITALKPLPTLWLVLVKPAFGVATREIYRHYRGGGSPGSTDRLLEALAAGDRERVLDSMSNQLGECTVRLYPGVGRLLERLRKLGAEQALVSGSGPTVFGVFPGEAEARVAAAGLEGEGRRVFICHTVND